MKLQPFSLESIMTQRIFTGWQPNVRFSPSPNDLIFANSNGLYSMQDRVTLIVRWRNNAEQEALNAILNMMSENIK